MTFLSTKIHRVYHRVFHLFPVLVMVCLSPAIDLMGADLCHAVILRGGSGYAKGCQGKMLQSNRMAYFRVAIYRPDYDAKLRQMYGDNKNRYILVALIAIDLS